MSTVGQPEILAQVFPILMPCGTTRLPYSGYIVACSVSVKLRKGPS